MLRAVLPLLSFFISFLALVSSHASAQVNELVKTVDGSEYSIVSQVWEPVLSIRVENKSIRAVFRSIGKGGMRDRALQKLKRTNPKLHKKFNGITTAIELEQEGRRLYIHQLETVDTSKFQPGDSLECDIYLLNVRTAAGTSYVAVIRSTKLQ